jgi:hypothetical protein
VEEDLLARLEALLARLEACRAHKIVQGKQGEEDETDEDATANDSIAGHRTEILTAG